MLNIFFLSLSRSLPCPIVFKSGALWLCALWMAIANSWAQRSSSHVTVKIFNKTDFVGLIGILTGWATHYSRYKACLYSRGGWFYVGKTLYWFSLSCSSFSHDSHINCHGGHPIAVALAFGHGINFNFQMQFNCDTHLFFPIYWILTQTWLRDKIPRDGKDLLPKCLCGIHFAEWIFCLYAISSTLKSAQQISSWNKNKADYN